MFLTLLLVTLVIAGLTAIAVAWTFGRPIRKILDRLVSEELGSAWASYVRFAIVVVGISGGVRIHALERYLVPRGDAAPLVLNQDRWILEVYGALIGALQSMAWFLLIFFLFALIAYVLVRGFEHRQRRPEHDLPPG
jgi:high-affinity nickel permease